MHELIILLLSYFLGAIPVGLLMVKAFKGVDVRSYGSGNIGTINVLRVGGYWVAALVLIADVAKGAVPVLLASYLGLSSWIVVLAGLIAISGHNWSIFLGFKGGKGVATTLGVLVALSPLAALVAAVVWVLVVAITKYSSLGSMLGALSAPITLYLTGAPQAYILFGVIGSLFVLVRHKANIQRLIKGEELKFSQRYATEKREKE